MVKVRVLRAFANVNHEHGNRLGVIEDGASLPDLEARTTAARALGYSESVVIEDPETATVRMYSARKEVPFAGHAAVGVSWLLGQMTGHVPTVLRTAAGEAPTWQEDGITWVRSTLRTTPAWWHERLSGADDVEALHGPQSPLQDMTQLWAWIDEPGGIMRVRTFAAKVGVDEDEACGSGAMRMAAAHGRSLTLIHGGGSIIYAKPGPPGYADVGGHVVEDAPRTV